MSWLAGVAGTLAGAGLFGAAIWKAAAWSQRPRVRPIESIPSMPHTSVSFTSQGSRLQGWLAVPPGEGVHLHPCVVIVHGWSSNRARVLRYAGPLYDAGYAVLLFDARSHGESDAIAAPSGFMFRDDVEAAVAFIRAYPGIDPARIAVLGHSLGGFGALLAVERGLQVQAVIADSTPLSMETVVKAELKRKKLPMFPFGYLIPFIWLLRSKINASDKQKSNLGQLLEKRLVRRGTPVTAPSATPSSAPSVTPRTAASAQAQSAEAAAELTASSSLKGEPHVLNGVPLLMIHSMRDDYIPPDELVAMVKRLPVQHVLVDAPGHSVSEQDPAFWSAVLAFLRAQ